jgi:N-ethylmaleimide reductase
MSCSLFDPAKMGDVEVQNRVFMAPLTRNRARPDGVPGEHAAEYYSQRASAGLIFTEATQISPMGKGYLNTPGIHSQEQIDAWKTITDGVHAKDGKIFLQLWHVGRISHTSLLPGGAQPVAPSAIRAQAQTFTAEGPTDVSAPREMTLDDIKSTIEDYRKASENAKKAGFDGVEVHAANGYLIDQFLRDKSNRRTDEYGGSAQNRVRFLKEAVDAAVDVWGAGRVGVRLAPTGTFNDMDDSNPLEIFGAAIDMLGQYGLAYLHMVEEFPGSHTDEQQRAIIDALREKWQGFYIANGGYDGPDAEKAIARHKADAVTFGRSFIANPDLPARLARDAALNKPDQTTFYGGGAKGYTDYPFMDASQAA